MNSETKHEELGRDSRQYRICDRIQTSRPDVAEILWRRIRPVLITIGHNSHHIELEEHPLQHGTWEANGLNSRLRFVRYKQGGVFAPHEDNCFTKSSNERSFWTVNIYLNDVYEINGGATQFICNPESIKENEEDNLKYQPKQGSALLFYQPGNMHEGLSLLSGKKYLMRTDVMFHRNNAILASDHLSLIEKEAINLYKEAQKQELEGNGEASWRFYRRAFHLWPRLETLDFDGLQ